MQHSEGGSVQKNGSLAAAPPCSAMTNLKDALVAMGVSSERADRSLAATGHRSVALATNWLAAHASDPTLDSTDHDRVFHIHLTPRPQSGFCQRLLAFRHQTQWNQAHSKPFHIKLGAFTVSDCNALAVTKAMKATVCHYAMDFSKISNLEMDKFNGGSGIGLVPVKSFEAFIRGLEEGLRNELSAHGAVFDESKSCHSLFLAQQFSPAHSQHISDTLAKLSYKSEQCDWQVRLYSSDPRLARAQGVFRVAKTTPSSPSRSEGTLDLCVNDYVATNELSTEGAHVTGTSWLTGRTGRVSKSVLEKCCHSNVWTLHCCVPAWLEASANDFKPKDIMPALAESLKALSQNPTEESVAPKSSKSDRQIYIVRHGERVDYSFGKNWMSTCFDVAGKAYKRRDLNMPRTVPLRPGGLEAWSRDCPLTRIGEIEAELTGEAMRDSDVKISHVFASPSLRCVQTAHHILKGLGSTGLKIHVEPGLFEWLGWYVDGMPAWLPLPDLAAYGYNVDENYCPYIPSDGLRDTWHQSNEPETVEQFYERNSFVTQCILQRTEGKGGNLLLVAHAISGDTCSRQVTGNDPRSYEQMIQITRKVGYCGVTVLQEEEVDSVNSSFLRTSSESLNSRRFQQTPKKKVWKLREPPFPPLTGVQGISASHHQTFDWRMLLEKDTDTN